MDKNGVVDYSILENFPIKSMSKTNSE